MACPIVFKFKGKFVSRALSFAVVLVSIEMTKSNSPVRAQCTNNTQCHVDGMSCTCDQCVDTTCFHTPVGYGNVNCGGPVNPDLDDILCTLNGFANFPSCPNGDIAPPCTGDNIVNLDDILGVLSAFTGNDPCSCNDAVCTPGESRACYSGPPETEDVGPCIAGEQVCDPEGLLGWGPCTGEVTPISEICSNGVDDDCNNVIDDQIDADGDGWSTCDGDCCDAAGACGVNPELVNPGALELVGNGIDDDCDAATSDEVAPFGCSNTSKFTNVTATDLAQAMGICQLTSANPPLALKKWGLISGTLLHLNGASPSSGELTQMQNYQAAVMHTYGAATYPTEGNTLAGLSNGRMRDAADPGFALPIPGTDFGRSLFPPSKWTDR